MYIFYLAYLKEEREARETIRREQEEAFKESLAADRKKVRQFYTLSVS